MIMEILIWILLGLVAGFLAKAIMPGRQGGGWIATAILGIVGALVGGWLAEVLNIGGHATGFNLSSIITAVCGALVVLFVYGLVTKSR